MYSELSGIKNAPDPIRRRENFVLLENGWQISFDGDSFCSINVPFCPQSKLSGIEKKEKLSAVFYRKTFTVDSERPSGYNVILRFGAVDYETSVFVNGKFVGKHSGGYTPFSFDITRFVLNGENELFIEVRDDKENVASGKQTTKDGSYGCFYTRVIGIWQPVWLEYVPDKHIKNFRFYPDISGCSVNVELETSEKGAYSIEIFFDGKKVGEDNGETDGFNCFSVPLSEKRLWKIGEGNLYDVKIKFEEDEIFSYFGLREIKYDGYKFLLNQEEVYQKLVLVQGYYVGGIYTPSDVSEMQKDVDYALRLGFNGMRLHQKVFDPRFLYLCDKAGIMVWGEFASWGVDYSSLSYFDAFLSQWTEVLNRDFNHPCIVTWCPLNEVWGDGNTQTARDVRFVDGVYEFTKSFDKTRPCVDVSGGYHGHKTDVYDFHCYEEPEKIKEYLDRLKYDDLLDVPLLYDKNEDLRYKKGTPTNLSEFGGIPFGNEVSSNKNMTDKEWFDGGAWGYGAEETDGDKFVERYRELVELILKYDKISGFCYTQLYDVEQEKNGFYNYDRTDKLTEEQKDVIREINSRR